MEANLTQELVLPSKGYLNPELPEGKLTQRCMMVSDQKFLSGSNRNAGNALHQMLQRTITSPEDFDINNLTPADTLYLLFKLRMLSYGDEYVFMTRCPECGKKIEVKINMADLPVETLEPGFADSLAVKLPHRGDTVYTKILRNSDIEEINKEIQRRKRKHPNDDSSYILRIVYSIDKIKLAKDKTELTHPVDIERYINELTDYDASAIIDARDSVEYGISSMIEYQCPECREDIDISLQFSGEFFRPSSRR